MRKLIIFGVGALVGVIGTVAVLSKLSAKDKPEERDCDGDCDCADFEKVLSDMCGKIQQAAADITHIGHCAPTNTNESVDWDDPCLKCTSKGSKHCDKGIENCPFASDNDFPPVED